MNDETYETNQPSELLTFTQRAFSRRGFLVGTGVTGAAVVAASRLGGVAGASTTSGSTRRVQSGGNKDAETAAFAASLEVLAVNTYKAALDAAQAGSLGPVPPAGAEFVTTAMAQHQAQLDKWNEVLTSAGAAPVTTPDPGLEQTVNGEFAKVTDFGGAATLARTLEEIAAATYLKAIPTLQSPDAITLAGSINVIDMQHVAVLNFVLGEYPVPDTFAKTDKAATPS